MNTSLQRLEILLVGLMLLLSGIASVGLLVLSPSAPELSMATPVPLGRHGTRGASAPAAEPTIQQLSASATIALPTQTANPVTTPAQVPDGDGHVREAPEPIDKARAISGEQATQAAPIWPALALGVTLIAAALISGLGIRKAARRLGRMRLRPQLPRLRRSIPLPKLTLRRPRLTLPRRPIWQWPRLPRLPLPGRMQTRRMALETNLPGNLNRLDDLAPLIPSHVQREQPQRPTAEIHTSRGLGVAPLEEAPVLARPGHDLERALAGMQLEAPAISEAEGEEPAETWTAEDRVVAVAACLAEQWAAGGLVSPILSLDTGLQDGDGIVVVTLDVAPNEEAMLQKLPARIERQRQGWQARWDDGHLLVEVARDEALPAGGPLLLPALDHQGDGTGLRLRRKQIQRRFFPLASQRHLGVYGRDALGAAHAMLAHLLFVQPPHALALAFLDRGELSTFYKQIPHRVSVPGDGRSTLDAVSATLRRGAGPGVRPLLLVIVDPDDTLLIALSALVRRLRAQPLAPVHLLLVQTRLSASAGDVTPVLPALVTTSDQEALPWLPGGERWPKPGTARLVSAGTTCTGRACTIDEAEIAGMLSGMRAVPEQLPPVLWEEPAHAERTPTGTITMAQDPAPADEPSPDAPQEPGEAEGDPLRRQTPAPESAPQDASTLATTLVARLERAAGKRTRERAGVRQRRVPTPARREPPPPWPQGFSPEEVAARMVELATHQEIAKAVPGFVKGRLSKADPAITESLARQLMVWLDAAGVLVTPETRGRPPLQAKKKRWQEPRPLAAGFHENATAIAERLQSTPFPRHEDVRAAFTFSEEA